MPDYMELIRSSVAAVVSSDGFTSWLSNENAVANDLVLINNSFVFRNLKTVKSPFYLALTLGDDGQLGESISLATGMRFNSDFKRISGASDNLPALTPLEDGAAAQVAELGHMVFLLVGTVDDTEVLTEELQHSAFDLVQWDPQQEQLLVVAGQTIRVNPPSDIEGIRAEVGQHYAALNEPTPEGLTDKLDACLDRLQDRAIAHVHIPEPGEELGLGITDAILTVLVDQRDQYALAVEKHNAGGDEADSALTDVLRIAYNFSSDATGFLRLIVSVCDLKPVVLWGTVAEHYALSRAFHALPWTGAKRKPSLDNYRRTVADARNSAFHNIFPFRKSLRIPLPDSAIGSPELQIFSEYGKKAQNQLIYADKELVDVLVDFTRARERTLAPVFWLRNLDVMNRTIDLFTATNEMVKSLAVVREA